MSSTDDYKLDTAAMRISGKKHDKSWRRSYITAHYDEEAVKQDGRLPIPIQQSPSKQPYWAVADTSALLAGTNSTNDGVANTSALTIRNSSSNDMNNSVSSTSDVNIAINNNNNNNNNNSSSIHRPVSTVSKKVSYDVSKKAAMKNFSIEYGAIGSCDTDDSPDSTNDSVCSNNTSSSIAYCSINETIFNLTSLVTGSGLLALPAAANMMGWSAVLLLCVVAIIFMYTFSLLAESIETVIIKMKHGSLVDELSNALGTNSPFKVPSVPLHVRLTEYVAAGDISSNRTGSTKSFLSTIDYGTLGKAAFGRHGDKVTMLILSIEMLLALTSFLINIGINMSVINTHIQIHQGILISAVVSLILSTLSLQKVAYTSALGLIMTLLVVISLLLSAYLMPPLASMDTAKHYKYISYRSIPISIGLITFCFGGHGAFPKIYTSMSERARYTEVLTGTGIITVTIYALIMVCGYYTYAQYTQIVITENIGRDLQNNPLFDGNVLRSLAAVGILFNLQVTIPLILMPLKDIMGKVLRAKSCTDSSGNSGSSNGGGDDRCYSFSIIAACTLLALFTREHFGSVCSLIGSLVTVLNSIVMPLFFYHSLYPTGLIPLSRVILHTLILLFAGATAFIGVSAAMCELSHSNSTGFCALLTPTPSSITEI